MRVGKSANQEKTVFRCWRIIHRTDLRSADMELAQPNGWVRRIKGHAPNCTATAWEGKVGRGERLGSLGQSGAPDLTRYTVSLLIPDLQGGRLTREEYYALTSERLELLEGYPWGGAGDHRDRLNLLRAL